jgi:hypothetical protein
MYIHFSKWVVSNHGGSTEATCGYGRVSHVFSGLVSMSVFYTLKIRSGYIHICNGCIAPTCTPPPPRATNKYASAINTFCQCKYHSNTSQQQRSLRGPATVLSRKFLHDLTTARHFRSFFVMCIIRKFTTKIEKFQLRGNNSVCAGAFELLHGRAPA